jgi:hypothetical protein
MESSLTWSVDKVVPQKGFNPCGSGGGATFVDRALTGMSIFDAQ